MKRKADQTEDQPRKKTKIGVTNTNLFDLLPDEILQEVLSYLNDHDLRWTRLVECRLFALIDIRHFDIGLVLDSELSEVTHVFGRYDKPIGLTFRKADKINSDFKALSQLTQLTSLDIGTKTIDVAKLTNLQSLTATVIPRDIEHHSRLTCFETSGLQVGKSPKYPAQLELLNIDYLLRFYHRAIQDINSEYEQCFKAMPNITKLHVTGKIYYSLKWGIRCHLTGLEYLQTGASITDLPVNTMTELIIDANHDSFDYNWSFSHLTNLRRLNITGSHLIKNTSLLPFTLLESLILESTESDKADAHLTQLNGSNITQLDVTLSKQDSLERVMAFTNLQDLSLDLTNVDIDRLSQLTRLTRLTLPCTVQNIGECTKLKNLMELAIGTKNPSEHLFVVSSLTRLTSLKLGYPRTVDMSNMTNLQNLQIAHGKPIIVGLSTLHNLTSLSCSNYSLTDEICTTLTALQYLIVLNVMSDQTLESVAKLTRLTYLNGRTSGTGACLTRLTRLQDFYIHANEGSKKIAKDLHEKLIFCLQDPAYTYTYLERNDDTYQDDSDDDFD